MNPDPSRDDQLKRDLLPGLLTELERTRRKRVVRTRIAAASSAAALVALAVFGARLLRPVTPPTRPLDIATGPMPTPVTVVRTDPGALDRWTVRTDPGALVAATTPAQPSTTVIEILDDRRLLDYLASVDRPAGLIRSQGRVWLTQDVTDPLPESPG